jgi:predicted secreted protein
MAIKLGMDCKLYYAASNLADVQDATIAAATWVEVTNVVDVTLNLEKGEADVTTRSSGGWRAALGTLKEGSIEFEMRWNTGDAFFTAIKTAWLAGTYIAIAAMDGAVATTGSTGLVGNFSVIGFSRSEPLEEAAGCSVRLKPADSTKVTWYTK